MFIDDHEILPTLHIWVKYTTHKTDNITTYSIRPRNRHSCLHLCTRPPGWIFGIFFYSINFCWVLLKVTTNNSVKNKFRHNCVQLTKHMSFAFFLRGRAEVWKREEKGLILNYKRLELKTIMANLQMPWSRGVARGGGHGGGAPPPRIFKIN